MDPPRFIAVVQRVNASLGVTWATAVLASSQDVMSPPERTLLLLFLAFALHTAEFGHGFEYELVSTTKLLLLTVAGQQAFSMQSSTTASVQSA
eukprot:3073552-Rhodomonas_salina.1